MNKFLFELGTEEIPAGMIDSGLTQLIEQLLTSLTESGVHYERAHRYSSPRRLAFLIEGLPEQQPDREDIQMGPPRSVALDEEGQARPAALGFARKMGVPVEDLQLVTTEKGEYLSCRRTIEGKAVRELLPGMVTAAVKSISWPKNMYWSESRFRFVRPLRWFVALWNDEVLELRIEEIQAGRSTRGHRFLSQGPVEITHADQYVEQLAANGVLVDLEQREAKIDAEIEAQTPDGLSVLPDAELRHQVAYLNEFPAVLRGAFESRFLEIPQEVLITVMRHHQKYFALVDPDGQLKPWFLTVLNTRGDERGKIRRGHERVLKARLEDASFFWRTDQQKSLPDRVEGLDRIVFQKELGSYLEKTNRIVALCAKLSDDRHLQEAARLCKTDLTTSMVFEMPELQGVMGGLYARQEGHPEAVWRAIYEQYQPQSMDDATPSSRNGALLSIADRLDTVVGCFRLGIVPSGSSDPFALRRLAQGVVKILLEQGLHFRLEDLVKWTQEGYPGEAEPAVRTQVLEFLARRLRFILQEQGTPYDTLNAIFAVELGSASEVRHKAEAFSAIRSQPDFEALAAAFKRVRNILAKEATPTEPVDPALLAEGGEIELHRCFESLKPAVTEALDRRDYLQALRHMATLRTVVDQFFDEVMVLVDDPVLRRNRLRLLEDLSDLFLQVADISEIVESAG